MGRRVKSPVTASQPFLIFSKCCRSLPPVHVASFWCRCSYDSWFGGEGRVGADRLFVEAIPNGLVCLLDSFNCECVSVCGCLVLGVLSLVSAVCQLIGAIAANAPCPTSGLGYSDFE
jgi:hypothetical protein